jgi:predicted HicB family RNase H-like nuclease
MDMMNSLQVRIEKTIMLRGIDADVWLAAKAQAKAEGMYLNRWIERALRRELARTTKTGN